MSSKQFHLWSFHRDEGRFDIFYFDCEFCFNIGGLDLEHMFLFVRDDRRNRCYVITVAGEKVEAKALKTDLLRVGIERPYPLSNRQRLLMDAFLRIGEWRSRKGTPEWARPYWQKALKLVP